MNEEMEVIKEAIDKLKKLLEKDRTKMTGEKARELNKSIRRLKIDFLYEKALEDLK
jgi:predicted DNA-binding ArsR family transcriptional regulator